MAVIVQYIVVRNGVQKMTFTTKKEADNYDKMLDIADNMYELIESAEMDVEEKLLEDLSLYLAKHKEKAISILRGIKPKSEKEAIDQPADADKPVEEKKVEQKTRMTSGSKIKGKIKKK
jgi:dsDNA-binding SOS-regulon protein